MRRRGKAVQSEILINSEKSYREPDEWNLWEGAGGGSRCKQKEKEMNTKEERERDEERGEMEMI